MNESEIRRQLCEILGVSAQASAEETKKAYTSEAKKWHPDRVQHNPELAALAEKKLKEINQAYECLTDRVQFDKYAAKLVQKTTARASTEAASSASANASSGAGTTAGANGGSTTGSTSEPAGAKSKGSRAAAPAAPPTDKGGIVKIFLATGLFVIIVIIVANLTERRNEVPTNSGITLSPSESPGAPFQSPRTFTPQPTSLPPDSSISAPPGSN